METAKIKPVSRLRSRRSGPSRPGHDALPCRDPIAAAEPGGFQSNPSKNHPKKGKQPHKGEGIMLNMLES
ncbi:hypothetical protein Taro_034264 [Colocasia esculenta]|uniref:Uncharacterized protein n=1 Tax=Colocasia esculenta TaxID=4460 RepID=A0A843VXC7_COLES|nr:hypothetical protein [Colocasia esculenta]